MGPIEFSIPKLALPRSSYIGLALVGTEILRHIPLSADKPWDARRCGRLSSMKRAWLCDFDSDAPTDVMKAGFDDWKTPSDPHDSVHR